MRFTGQTRGREDGESLNLFFLILEQVFFTIYGKESWFGALILIQNERYRIEE